MDAFEPRPVPGAVLRDLSIAGALFPWADDIPVYVGMPGTDDLFLPLFSEREQLARMMLHIGIQPHEYTIKVVEDQQQFVQSVPFILTDGIALRIVLDLRVMPDGMIRFTEIFRGGDET